MDITDAKELLDGIHEAREQTREGVWLAQGVARHLAVASYARPEDAGFHIDVAHDYLRELATLLGYRLERTMPYTKP